MFWLRLLPYGVTGLIALYAWGAGSTVIDNYTTMSAKIERLSHENKLYKSRLESYNLRIERRDQAISASKCKAQINQWLRNPDQIPLPADPFKSTGGS